MIRLLFFSICAVLLTIAPLSAQHEVGASLGTSTLLGDFGGGSGTGGLFIKDIDGKSFRPSAGIFYRYHFKKRFSVKTQFLYGQLVGNDDFAQNEFRFDRGLTSNSIVLDLSNTLEWNIIPINFSKAKNQVTPYIGTGIGFAYTSAKVGQREGEQNRLAMEAQYITDKQPITVNIPLNVGVKYFISPYTMLGLEVSHRLAFGDHLDNYVRQQSDQFFFISANVAYVLPRKNGLASPKKSNRTFF